jgi:hypothetical protein
MALAPLCWVELSGRQKIMNSARALQDDGLGRVCGGIDAGLRNYMIRIYT